MANSVENHGEARPVHHFTPKVGFMNDPNGLVYSNGIWRLYFQLNTGKLYLRD
jgi:beta-fructofuranosidase